MPRLFTALLLPDGITSRLAPLMSGLPGARWAAPGDLHITLRFVGDVDGGTARDIALALADQPCPALTIELAGMNAYGGSKPRSVHVRISTNPALEALNKSQEQLMQSLGLPPERRKYQPHITLARLRQTSPRAVADWLSSTPQPRETFAARSFHLMSARESTGGAPYVPLETYYLDGD